MPRFGDIKLLLIVSVKVTPNVFSCSLILPTMPTHHSHTHSAHFFSDLLSSRSATQSVSSLLLKLARCSWIRFFFFPCTSEHLTFNTGLFRNVHSTGPHWLFLFVLTNGFVFDLVGGWSDAAHDSLSCAYGLAGKQPRHSSITETPTAFSVNVSMQPLLTSLSLCCHHAAPYLRSGHRHMPHIPLSLQDYSAFAP